MKDRDFIEPMNALPNEGLSFSEALDFHMSARGDTAIKLLERIIASGENFTWTTIVAWRRGTKYPRSVKSFEILERIESHYGLPKGYFKERLPHQARARVGHSIHNIDRATRRRIAWHLPDDFSQRSQL